MLSKYIQESIRTKQLLIENIDLCNLIEKSAQACTDAYNAGNKLLVCGNGGSATDALHMVGELVGRFQKERCGIQAIALNENVAVLTALANDYSYQEVFKKQVAAYGQKGDILIAISTSGNSVSVVNAARQARKQEMQVVSLTGNTGGALKKVSDYCIQVPDEVTAHIQEAHITILHYMCKYIEERLFR